MHEEFSPARHANDELFEREGLVDAADDWPLSTFPHRVSESRLVFCLACGHSYSKPFGGGIALENPGCPSCAYAGWAEPVRRELAKAR
jgi:hypothetical protein